LTRTHVERFQIIDLIGGEFAPGHGVDDGGDGTALDLIVNGALAVGGDLVGLREGPAEVDE
jgi:hypothetical protein